MWWLEECYPSHLRPLNGWNKWWCDERANWSNGPGNGPGNGPTSVPNIPDREPPTRSTYLHSFLYSVCDEIIYLLLLFTLVTKRTVRALHSSGGGWGGGVFNLLSLVSTSLLSNHHLFVAPSVCDSMTPLSWDEKVKRAPMFRRVGGGGFSSPSAPCCSFLSFVLLDSSRSLFCCGSSPLQLCSREHKNRGTPVWQGRTSPLLKHLRSFGWFVPFNLEVHSPL